MPPRQRLTKKDIRQDQFVTTMLKSREIFEEYKTYFIIGILAIAALAVIVFLISSSSQAKAREANEIFGRASVEFRSGNFQLAAVDFQSILDNYGGTDVARLACYHLANCYFELKNYDQAEQFYGMYLDKHKSNDVVTSGAMNGLAHCFRAKGLMAEAAAEFKGAYEHDPDGYLAPENLFWGADSFAHAGSADEARELYELFKMKPGEAQRALRLQQTLIEKGALDPTVGAFD